MPRSEAEVLITSLRDPRLAVHAVSALPAWLWAPDGSRILWANAAGAAVFGCRTASELVARHFGPADQHRRQVARLAGQLPDGAVRLERLQGFGAALGRLRTCACSRIGGANASTGLLVAAAEPAGRAMAYPERVQRLTDGIDGPAAAFDAAGSLIEANAAARKLIPFERPDEVDLSVFGLDLVSAATLSDGHATIPAAVGEIELFRLGHGHETTLLALIRIPVPEAPAQPEEIQHEEMLAPAADDTVAPAVAAPGAPAEIAEAVPALASQERHPDALPGPTAEIVPEAATMSTPPVPPVEAAAPASAEQPPAASTAACAAPADVATAGAAEEPTFFTHAEAVPVVTPTQEPGIVEMVAGAASNDEQPFDSLPAPAIESAPAGATWSAPREVAVEAIAAIDHANEQASEHASEEQPPAAVETAAVAPAAVEAEATPEAAPPAPPAPQLEPPPIVALPSPQAETAALHLPEEPTPHEVPGTPRRHPLRFVWQMDAAGRFALGSDEFCRLIGSRTATAFGRPWSEIAAQFDLDPDGRVAAAIATQNTWSGIVVHWPVDGPDTRLPVELSGLPILDRARQFVGYRGFGICRDLDGLDRLAAQRRRDALGPPPPAPHHDEPRQPPPENAGGQDLPFPAGLPSAPSPQPTDPHVETPQNVVPFRLASEPKVESKVESRTDSRAEQSKAEQSRTPTLTPVENNAFNELARQLASRLEAERIELEKRDAMPPVSVEPAAPASEPDGSHATAQDAPAAIASEEQPPWTASHPVAPRAEARRDALLYDRIPVGILVYQLDRLVYANRAFLDRVGYPDLQALTAAGGLDALFVEPGVGGGSSTSEEGTPVRIAATATDDAPADARLHSISWDGDAAHALIFAAPRGVAAPVAAPAPPAAAVAAAPTTDADAAELHAILDASDDGVVIVDRDGAIVGCNAGARRLFGAPGHGSLAGRLADLFAASSQDALREEFDAARQTGAVKARELAGLSRDGRVLALRLTMGRTDGSGTRYFAICRDLSEARGDHEAARRKQAERTASARADVLARISQDLRTPLNAIVGFADVMIEERFGALGNDRYAAYLRDIRASAERMLATINDMVDLSRAETGQLHLSLTRQDLNDTVESCVAVLQPQANRERIIIRTALAQSLPPVTADTAALRQIVLNLIGNSIHVARAGGQIIVSTAVTDLGDIVLRVRDTGRGLNYSEMEAALEQFRSAPSEQVAQDNAGINMSLTRALVEANRAQFHIRSAPHSGTLIEVAFPPLTARTA
ncbi:MAG: PAS domain-containing protein [Xanthobacteraceae bacterium]